MISSTAIFACSDIEATLAYYKDVLGFESTWTYGEPPNFGGATKGGVSIMFCLQPELASNIRGHQHWIKVDEVDELYEQHKAKGAKIVSEIEDRPWGVREYDVEDINGYHLRFAGPPSSEVPKSRPFPEGVTLERGAPGKDDYIAVSGKTFGHDEPPALLLEQTWSGVLARSPEGHPIGGLRIMQDAPNWFSIWDVAVLPEWKAQRIGSVMVKEAVEMIREASPRAIIHLFTFSHGFYERLGFNLESASVRRL